MCVLCHMNYLGFFGFSIMQGPEGNHLTHNFLSLYLKFYHLEELIMDYKL